MLYFNNLFISMRFFFFFVFITMLSWVSSLANSNADSNSRCCFYICRCRDANVQCLYRAVGKWSCCLTAQSQTERVELMCLCVVSVNVNVTSSWTHHVLREPFWSGRGVFLCPCVCVFSWSSCTLLVGTFRRKHTFVLGTLVLLGTFCRFRSRFDFYKWRLE